MEILVSAVGLISEFFWPVSVFKSSRNRANCKAKTTASAVCSYLWLMGLWIKSNSLISRIKASHITFSTVHAKIIINYWEFLLFRHMSNLFNMLHSLSSDVFKSWNFININFSGFLTFLPEMEIIFEFLQFLHGVNGWALSFPSFLDKVVSLHQI